MTRYGQFQSSFFGDKRRWRTRWKADDAREGCIHRATRAVDLAFELIDLSGMRGGTAWSEDPPTIVTLVEFARRPSMPALR
jgi:hypothetical protein